MKNWSPELKAHYAGGRTTLALCWKATLTNGTVVTTTSHDRNIEYPVSSGVIYLSTAAYTPSDVESGADMAPDNLEVEGFLASPHIVASDVHSGLWDYAEIEIFEVNYNDLTMGRNLVRCGTLGEVKTGLASFRAELRGLMQAYSRRIVRLIQPTCDADLGDARCGIDLAAWTVLGTVDTVVSNSRFTDATRSEANDMFTGGKVTFTTGLNVGLSMEVKSSTAAGVIVLQEAMPFDIAVGDAYSMYTGCQKRLSEDCIGKFDNVVNFRGFPHLPGSRVYAGPHVGINAPTPTPTPAPAPPPEGPPPPAPAPGGSLDLSPDAFSFTPDTITGAATSSLHYTDVVTVGGLTPGVEVYLTAAGPGVVGVSAAPTAGGLGTYSPVVDRFVVPDGSLVLQAQMLAPDTAGASNTIEVTVYGVWGYGATFQGGTPQAATFTVST